MRPILFPLVLAMGCALRLAPAAGQAPKPDVQLPLPQLLSETGLYAAAGRVRAGIQAYAPQYPLWSDGADKQRWLYLAPGTFIDASQPDAWAFPRGTKLWKEFAYGGRPVETRYIERLSDGSWRFASYIWNDAGTDAELAPAAGVAALRVAAAPNRRYAVPSHSDCLACHGSTPVPVLGVGALQLSPDRDPLAAGGGPPRADEGDLRVLLARGWLRGLPAELLAQPPRIEASTPVERAALGYLHGNCAHCHNTSEYKVPLDLTLAQRLADSTAGLREVLRSTVNAPSRYRPSGSAGEAVVVAPGRLQDSVLAMRMQSRNPNVRMPPLGTTEPDPEGLALIHRWIAHDLPHRKEPSP